MKTIIEFNLPEDQDSYEIHKQAIEMSIDLWEISQYLRKLSKYGHQFTTIEEAIDTIRTEFYSICSNLKEGTI